MHYHKYNLCLLSGSFWISFFVLPPCVIALQSKTRASVIVTAILSAIAFLIGLIGCLFVQVPLIKVDSITVCKNRDGQYFGSGASILRDKTSRHSANCYPFSSDLTCTTSDGAFCHYFDGTTDGNFIFGHYKRLMYTAQVANIVLTCWTLVLFLISIRILYISAGGLYFFIAPKLELQDINISPDVIIKSESFYTRNRYKIKFYCYIFIIACIITLIMFSGVWILLPLYNCGPFYLSPPYWPFYLSSPNGHYTYSETFHSNTTNIVLIGDSLLREPSINFDLIGLLHSNLRKYNLAFDVVAESGSKIHDINGFLYKALALKPDGVILFWDSDVSDVDISALSQNQLNSFKAEYSEQLELFIKSTNSSGVSVIGISGPSILGESWFGLPSAWWNKKYWIDEFIQLTSDKAKSHGIPYVDMKQQFLNAVNAAGRITYCGYLTFDGEHPIGSGTKIMAAQFATLIKAWIAKRRALTPRPSTSPTITPG